MTKIKREAFLQETSVGVLAIHDGDNWPPSTPIWFDYEPGGSLRFSVSPGPRKAKLLATGTKLTLVAQTESAPYKYVSVAGSVTNLTSNGATKFTLNLGIRYLGDEMGRQYFSEGYEDAILATIKVERWLTTDQSKLIV